MPDFVHLHVHSVYSLLDGAARLDHLITRAKELNMNALAITDHGVLYGIPSFYKKALAAGIKPVIGCEIYVTRGSRRDKLADNHHLVLLAENDTGYHNLIKLVSAAQIEGMYYKPRADKELLRRYSEGLICLSACLAGEIPSLILGGDLAKARLIVEEYIDIYGKDNFFLEIQNHLQPEDKTVNDALVCLSKEYGLKLVATNDAHYVERAGSEAQDILLCIQTNKTVLDKDRMKFCNDEFYLKSGEEMAALFPAFPEALSNSVKIAERCQVTIQLGQLFLPEFEAPEGQTPKDMLEGLCREQLPLKYPDDQTAAKERLAFELGVIHAMGYDSYFLIVWDFVNFARGENIPVGPGRGSAAGSIVSYLLGITNINPLKYDLLFERFLNPERISMPDIDIDFCYDRRGEVFDYVVRKYGADRVAQIATFGTMAARAAVKDVGRALGMPYNEVDKIAKQIPGELHITLDKALEKSEELRAAAADPRTGKLLSLAKALEGTPRHASVHAAGVVISPRPITEFVPLQLSADDFITTQYDKDQIEDIGLLKMDLLGLTTLTILKNACEMIWENKKIRIDLDKIPLQDKLTAAMLAKGQTDGVFQSESPGMTRLIRAFAPQGFADFIPLVALYRPGPLDAGMHNDFVERRHARSRIAYPHPLLEPILKDTFGVIVYQEQVMQIASVLAGFTLGQADILRKAMGKKQPQELARQKESFLRGAEKNGVEAKKAEEIFSLLEYFAGYGFNKSHSAAYALLAWQTAYLRANYPVEFMAAMLSNTANAARYIEACRRMGIKILPPDVNKSVSGFSAGDGFIRFGLSAIKNVGVYAIHGIVKVRQEGGEFTSLDDFCRRVDAKVLNKRVLESLVKCGAFDQMGKRAQLLEILDSVSSAAMQRRRDQISGQFNLFGESDEALTTPLPDVPDTPQPIVLNDEKELLGFYLSGHPLDKYRALLNSLKAVADIDPGELKDGQIISMGGVIAKCERRTSKSGEAMATLTIEDLTGQIEAWVFPRVFARYSAHIVENNIICLKGRIRYDDKRPKIDILEISPPSDIAPVEIMIDKSRENKDFFHNLKAALDKYPGKTPVTIALAGAAIACGIKVNRDAKGFKEELINLIGQDNVKF